MKKINQINKKLSEFSGLVNNGFTADIYDSEGGLITKKDFGTEEEADEYLTSQPDDYMFELWDNGNNTVFKDGYCGTDI